jgi:hypothetical protein
MTIRDGGSAEEMATRINNELGDHGIRPFIKPEDIVNSRKADRHKGYELSVLPTLILRSRQDEVEVMYDGYVGLLVWYRSGQGWLIDTWSTTLRNLRQDLKIGKERGGLMDI